MAVEVQSPDKFVGWAVGFADAHVFDQKHVGISQSLMPTLQTANASFPHQSMVPLKMGRFHENGSIPAMWDGYFLGCGRNRGTIFLRIRGFPICLVYSRKSPVRVRPFAVTNQKNWPNTLPVNELRQNFVNRRYLVRVRPCASVCQGGVSQTHLPDWQTYLFLMQHRLDRPE